MTKDLRITTFGQTTDLNSFNAVNRIAVRDGVYYCIQYNTYNSGFEKKTVAKAFADKMYNEHGWNIYNTGCDTIHGSGGGHYAVDYSYPSGDVNKNFGGEFGTVEVETWKWHSS